MFVDLQFELIHINNFYNHCNLNKYSILCIQKRYNFELNFNLLLKQTNSKRSGNQRQYKRYKTEVLLVLTINVGEKVL